MISLIINFSYLIAAFLFIIGLKLLSSLEKAKLGNLLSAIGMLIAILVTLFEKGVVDYKWIFIGLFAGSLFGVLFAQTVKMTAMPEMVALLNGFGGLASLLVGWGIYNTTPAVQTFDAATIFLSILIGGVTFTGSMVAWAKLAGKMPSKSIIFPFHLYINMLILAGGILLGVLYSISPNNAFTYVYLIIAISLILGITMVIPIGGADMPVVISLLNSYSGLAACTTGFVIQNNVLIVSGALVGASGIILTSIMCRAMNRSLANVLFSGFGAVSIASQDEESQEARSISPKDLFFVLEASKNILVVPGYGLAVAQAQHAVKELASLLENNGSEVKYAIHPVAGRMPGHMNVLLAEADVPYEQLIDMDEANKILDSIDACLVIGANDVVNPAAIEDSKSPIYGMPIIEAHRAKNVFILKRSMASGFAGIANPLFYKENVSMVFGDAKKTLQEVIEEF